MRTHKTRALYGSHSPLQLSLVQTCSSLSWSSSCLL